MKTFVRILPFALCGIIGTIFADDFKSMVIPADGMPHALPRVHGDQFMVIRNFTQEDGSSITRGVVMVSQDGGATWVQVLSAAFLDITTNPPDVINSVVIAGPADVRATCGATSPANCFISFKKDSN